MKEMNLQREGGRTADLDREDIFSQSQCIINGEEECHLLCFYWPFGI